MGVNVCPHCGGKVYSELDKCPHCGGPVTAEVTADDEEYVGEKEIAGMICFIITTIRLILKKPIISDRSLEKRLLAKYG